MRLAQVFERPQPELASVMLLHTYRPYVDGSTQQVALLTAWQTVLTIFAGLVTSPTSP